MEITDELIERLAHLSRLKFSEEEKEELKTDLNKIKAMMDKLSEVDTEGVDPLTHLSENPNHLREDKVIPTLTKEEVLRNAPDKTEDFFRVPKVIKKNSNS